MSDLEFHFDFRSPYSYLAHGQLGGLGTPVRYKPMDVLEVMKIVGNTPTTIVCQAKSRYANKDLGRWAQHGNGVLSRLRPARVSELKLPGLPGRGAVIVELDLSDGGILAICILHLALGWRARGRQLRHIAQVVQRYPYLVMMGDFNCGCRSRSLRQLVRDSDLRGLDCELKTFPSWQPRRSLDHILVSNRLRILDAEVVDYPLSDHLPLSMTIALPEGVQVL